MFETAAATVEEATAYQTALEREKEGYAARIAGLKDGNHDPLDAKALEARIKDVDGEIKRAKALAGKAAKAEGESDE